MKQGCLYQPPFSGDVTYMFGTAGSSFMNHKHLEVEALYCLEGNAHVVMNGQEWRMKKGELLLVLPLDEHLIDSEENNDLLYVELGEVFLGQKFSFFLENEISKRRYYVDNEMRELLTTIGEMRFQTEEESIYYEWDKKAILYTFASKLVRMLEGVEKRPKKTEEKKKTSIKLNELFTYINDNYMNEITLQTAEELLRYERKYICRVFKEATGLTFHKYINACRIDRACNLIDAGISFTDVRNSVGLPDERTFIRVFTSYKDMTPTEYKNRKKKQNDR